MAGVPRKIIHIDMDAFFAAVEQRDFPQYRNKPIVVGGRPDSRGVVATCSYEARKYGIRSAMPSATAYRLCPEAIFLRPRFDAYQEASTIIRQIFGRYSELVEPVALDEAYLDVSSSLLFHGSATLLAKQIKQDIFRETRLIASAGISYNKFLAKIASNLGKPNGLYLIKPEQAEDIIVNLEIGKFHGIGKVTELKMRQLGIENGRDLKSMPLTQLRQHFGKAAQTYFDMVRGLDKRPVCGQRLRKSLGVETTFAEDIVDEAVILQNLQLLFQKIHTRLQEKNLEAYTLTLKIKFQNFVQITRSRTLPQPIKANANLDGLMRDLLKNTAIGEKKVRLLGVTLSGLYQRQDEQAYMQIDLFDSG